MKRKSKDKYKTKLIQSEIDTESGFNLQLQWEIMNGKNTK